MADNGQIDNIYIDFEVKDDNAEQKITAIDNALEKLENTLEKLDTSSIDKALDKIPSASGSNAFDGIGESANKAAVSIEYLMSKQGKLDYLQNELAQAYTKLLELTQGGEGYENQDVKKLVRQIEKLEKDIDKLGDEGDKAFKKIDKSTKKANNSSKNYNKGLRGLIGTAKRFLVFGAFFTIQRQISQAFQEGTQNLYQYSKAIDGNFAQSMDRLTTSFLYMKNAIGAAVAPLINAITPALESLIDTVAEFGNKLAETFAALSGATTFKKAIKSHKEYAEAVNKTNNALAKFDEINNITTSKGKDELDYGSMFETAKVNVEFKNLNDFGEQLAQKLNEQIKKLDKADIGKKIGQKINGALEFANGFIKTFDFGEFTTTLLDEITDFIEEIDWLNVGELFSNLLKGALNIIESIAEWIANWDTTKIGDALCDFIEGIEWKEVGKAFWNALLAALKATSNILFGKDTVGTALSSTINFFKFDDRSFKERITELVSKVFSSFLKNDLPQMQKNPFAYFLGLFKKISGFADGGYPTSGEMFIARENGIPEMVGSIGGRTAVANNDQIVEAISIGVYNAYMDAMSRSGGNKQPTIVQINGREVFRAVQDESTAYSIRTGQPAF